MRCSRIIIGFIFLAWSVATLGQTAVDTLNLAEYEIVATRSAQKMVGSTSQYSSQDLESFRQNSLSQMLQLQSPVFIKGYGPGGLATASFRGTTASHTLVLWNDFPVNAPTLGQVDLSTIPVFFADNMQLSWGSRAAEQSGGIGGTISVENNAAIPRHFKLDVLQSVGSYRSYGSFADVSVSNGKLQSRTRLFRKSSVNNFEYLNTATLPARKMEQQQAGFTDYGLMQEIHLSTKAGILSLVSWNQWNDRNLPPIMPNIERGGNPEEFQNDRFHRNVIGFKRFWKGGKLELKTALFFENQHYYLRTSTNDTDPQTVTLIDAVNRSKIGHQLVHVEQNIRENWTLFAKFQWDIENVQSNNFSETIQRDKKSFTIGNHLFLWKYFNADLSLRQDFVDRKNVGMSPAFSLNFSVPGVQNLVIQTGLSKNYRNPSLNDLYWFPGGNRELNAERATSADVSINWRMHNNMLKLDMRLGAFASSINDWIQWRPSAYRYWIPENISIVYARGFETFVNFAVEMNQWKLNCSINYTYTLTTDESPVAKIENSSGKQLIYIPKHHANLFASLQYHKWQLGYAIDYTGERSTSLNEEEFYAFRLDPFALHQVRLGRTLSRFTVEARVNNLTNIQYQTVLWRPMPGRNFEFSIRYKL